MPIADADVLLLEDFAEWSAGTEIGAPSGVNWSASAGMPTIVADTEFHSGKAMNCPQSPINGTVYGFPAPVPQIVLTWNQRKITNNGGGAAFNNLYGALLFLDIAGYFISVQSGNNDVGLGNSYVVCKQNGASGTFAILAVSSNIYVIGAKHNFSLEFDGTIGTATVRIGSQVIYSGVPDPAFVGRSVNAIKFGRSGTGAGTAQVHCGDIFAYANNAYLGPSEVRSGFPTANLATQDWANVGGPAAWDSLNNSFSAATPTQYIESAVMGDISQFSCPVDNTNVGQIFAAEHRYRAIRTDVSPVDMNGEIGDGGGFTPGATTNPPQSAYEFFRDRYGENNPNSGTLWSLADMAAGEVGFERTS
jgi:hypothetical protein